MAIFKQPVKLIYQDGREVRFESIKDVMDETGYCRATIWWALNRGHFCTGKYKNVKIKKIETITVIAKDGSFENTYEI